MIARPLPGMSGGAMLLLSAFFFGVSFPVQRAAQLNTSVGPLSYAAMKNVSSLLFVLFARKRIIMATSDNVDRDVNLSLSLSSSRRLWLYGLVAGLTLSLGSLLQQIGLASVEAGTSAFLTSLYMIIIPFVECNTNFKTYIAAVVTLFGIYLLSGCSESSDCLGGEVGFGEICTLVSVVFWVWSIINSDRAAKEEGINVINFTIIEFGVGSCLGALLAAAFERDQLYNICDALIYIVAAGVSDGLACVFMILGQRDVSSSRAGLLLSLESVFSAATGFLFLHETLSCVELAGAALVLVGTASTNLEGGGDSAAKEGGGVRVSLQVAGVEVATERSLLQPKHSDRL